MPFPSSESRDTTPLRCAVFPRVVTENPYQRLLNEALERQGVRLTVDAPLRARIAFARKPVDAIHIHWLEWLLFVHHPRRAVSLALSSVRTLRLLTTLVALRLRGVAIVWTVHNLRGHESTFPRFERLAMRAVARLATALHVHSRWAAGRAASTLGVASEKVLVGYHGNYLDVYVPFPGSRTDARDRLGLAPDPFLFVIFGGLRPYKQVPAAVAAFLEGGPADAELLVAGQPLDENHADEIRTAARSDPRVHLRLGFVDDGDVAAVFRAADAAVLNYREVFSSGALMLALSFATPVVAPASGTALEIGGPVAVEAFATTGGLPEALCSMRGSPALDERRAAALQAAERCDWDSLAHLLVTALAAARRRSRTR